MSTPAKTTSARQWLALVVLCFGQLMIVLDGTVVNVALPRIQKELHFSQNNLAWVINAYLITFGGLLLLAGRLGDLLGRKRIFLAGLALFTVSSLLCGISQDQILLVSARFLQGIGAAMQSAMVLAMLSTLFPSSRDRTRAFSVYALVANVGGSIGLLVGGTITQLLSWHWIFFLNIPIGIASFVLAWVLLEDHVGAGFSGDIDAPGAFLVIAAPMLGVYTIVSGPTAGWGSPRTLLLALLDLGLFWLLVFNEKRATHPLLPPRLFRSRAVVGANVVRFFNGLSMNSLFFLTSLYLQEVVGFSPLGAGAAFMPFNLVIGLGSTLVVPFTLARISARKPILPALAIDAVAMVILARAPVDGTYARSVLPALLLIGIGQSFVFLPTVRITMAGIPPEDSGLASGVTSIAFQLGAAFGLAISSGVSTFVTARLIHDGDAHKLALTRGFSVCYLICATSLLIAGASTRIIPAHPDLDFTPTSTVAADAPLID